MFTVAVSSSASMTLASTRFICGVPMKPATKTLAGLAKMSCGLATCSMMPSRMTAIRSAMVSASIWSWVTITVALCRPLSSCLICPRISWAHGDVEAAERLVEQKALRVADDGTPHGDALLLALGKTAGHPAERVGEVEKGRDLPHAAVDLLLGDLLGVQRERQVVRHGQARVERVELEHHGDVPVAGREVVDPRAGDVDVARRHVLEPGDHAQRRGLAAAGRAEQAHHLAGLHVEVDVVDRGERAEVLAQVAKLDVGHGTATA